MRWSCSYIDVTQPNCCVIVMQILMVLARLDLRCGWQNRALDLSLLTRPYSNVVHYGAGLLTMISKIPLATNKLFEKVGPCMFGKVGQL